MKNYFVTVAIACALTICAVVIRQKAQAQNANPQTADKAGATIVDVGGAKTNQARPLERSVHDQGL